jgi:2,3-bisphosphoglycerate-independent phosphoglycerate mutase
MSSDSKTKFIILVPDGMADRAGDDKPTALSEAKTPWMDKVAAQGTVGTTTTIPAGLAPGSDVANLSIMGYSPAEVYTGRAPFEAASMGINLRADDLAFRMNLVTLDRNFTMMADYSADHISTPEAREIVKALEAAAEELGLTIHPGISYRHLLVWRNGPDGCVTHPPHDFPGELLTGKFPTGPGADVLLRLIIKSWSILETHHVNQRREQRCQGPANSVWPWGQGRRPKMKTMKERFNLTGSVVAAVDLVRGIGKYAGLNVVDVPGATGYLDTNYEGKVQAALQALSDQDFVYLHVEAPDEAGHSGQMDLKVKAIEDFDEKVVGPMLAGLSRFDSWKMLIVPDHCTPVARRIHTTDPVPYVMIDSAQWAAAKQAVKYSEALAAKGEHVDEACKMIEILFKQ